MARGFSLTNLRLPESVLIVGHVRNGKARFGSGPGLNHPGQVDAQAQSTWFAAQFFFSSRA